jgi:site-specific recombinase XerD
VSPHTLRHSAASYLLAAGVPDRVVMEILGHSTLAMTQRYSHVLGPMLADAASRLEALWTRSAGPS